MTVQMKINEDNAVEAYRYLRDAIAWYGTALFKAGEEAPAPVTDPRFLAAWAGWQELQPVINRCELTASAMQALQDWINTHLPPGKIIRLRAAVSSRRRYASKKAALAAAQEGRAGTDGVCSHPQPDSANPAGKSRRSEPATL